MNPLLSICVPTYNRLPYLRELLDELLSQVRTLSSEEVEVCISDNVSTDGTADYLSGLKCACLRWWTNPENIGGDRNFLKCIQEAKGDYVWLVGDDEILSPGAVCRVLDVLKKHRPGLLVSVDSESEPEGRIYPDYRSAVLTRPTSFVLAHTLISANVFKRTLFDMDFAIPRLNLSYAHMFGLMRNMSGEQVAVMSRFIVVRPVRAEFATYPSWLCVKQGVYISYLVRTFGLSFRYRLYAVRMICNLPLEWASRLKGFLKKSFARV